MYISLLLLVANLNFLEYHQAIIFPKILSLPPILYFLLNYWAVIYLL